MMFLMTFIYETKVGLRLEYSLLVIYVIIFGMILGLYFRFAFAEKCMIMIFVFQKIINMER